MASISRISEVETLLDSYERSGLDPKEFAEEFFRAVQSVVRSGIPARELRLCVRVPFQKPAPVGP